MKKPKWQLVPKPDETFKPQWFWYVAHDDELMMDCDGRTLLEIAIKRIQRATSSPEQRVGLAMAKGLQIASLWATNSQSADHWHLVIRLTRPMPVLYRMVWQLYFMDHCFRSVKNLFRALDGVPAPSLLISPHKWPNDGRRSEVKGPDGFSGRFWRKPDAVCECFAEHHKNPETILLCPAHKLLRGTDDGKM